VDGIGIPREDVVLDGICMAAAAGLGSFEVALATLAAVKREMDLTTTLGIGNAGFGMPDRTVIDQAYLLGAVPWGLDSALVEPNTSGLIESVRAMDFLTGRDEVGKRYIQLYRKKKSEQILK
jgi:5-methyltetrahydrofolate--homocysteine methyltransferase